MHHDNATTSLFHRMAHGDKIIIVLMDYFIVVSTDMWSTACCIINISSTQGTKRHVQGENMFKEK